MIDIINTHAIVAIAQIEAELVQRRCASSGVDVDVEDVYIVVDAGGGIHGFYNLSYANDCVKADGGAIYRLWRDELQRY